MLNWIGSAYDIYRTYETDISSIFALITYIDLLWNGVESTCNDLFGFKDDSD
jgi:hypothetical protein